jgi:hypothetical protein
MQNKYPTIQVLSNNQGKIGDSFPFLWIWKAEKVLPAPGLKFASLNF